MINGIEGIPGSGKSYEACVYHVLPALQAGRKVITNLPLDIETWAAIDPAFRGLLELRTKAAPVRGTWDANRLGDDGTGHAFELDAEAREPVLAAPFSGVWCYHCTWKHPIKSIGPLFVIDECHNMLPRLGTSPEVVQWFKLHRHFNCDVLLMTQSFRDVHTPIAQLLHVMVRARKADIMGRADKYIRKVHGGYRGAVISTEERPYKPQYFPLYRSHTQGSAIVEAAAADVSPFIVKFRRFTRVFVACSIAACVYAFWPSEKPKPAKPQPVAVAAKVSPAPAPVASAAPAVAAPVAPASAPEKDYPEPYKDHSMHITGHIVAAGRELYAFAIGQGGAVVHTVTTAELVRAGYQVRPLTDCSAIVSFGDRQRPVVCDVPRQAIFAGAPIGK